jgi:hypothetical protein
MVTPRRISGYAAGMADATSQLHPTPHLWLEQHGEEAVPKAREMVALLREKNDANGADAWLQLIVAIEEIRRGAAA